MKRLKDFAAAAGAEFEICSISVESRSVNIEDSELKDAESGMSSGVSLRLVKDGAVGFSFTKSLEDPKGLVDNALASCRAGVGAKFSFPGGAEYRKIKTNSEKAGQTTSEALLAESSRIAGILSKRASAQVNAGARLRIAEHRIINSAGVDVAWTESSVSKYGSIVSPGGSTYSAADRGFDLEPMKSPALEQVARLFEAGRFEVRPALGKQKVLFMPSAMETLLWRVRSGASGESLYQHITPLADRVGEEVFSKKLTLRSNPLDDSIPGGRVTDDEGVPCSNFVLVDRGIFRAFYYDLNYAAKLGVGSTGHGFRMSVWGGDPITLRPQPCLPHLCFDGGNKTFEELLEEMRDGVVVFETLGEHTGNIPNGDFSIGLSLGLCVKNGEIVGRAKDTLVSGNIYDAMKRVIAVGRDCDPVYGNNPPILLDGVDVSS